MSDSYDCVIIGGGPAGSTVGTLLAQQGHKTLLIERSEFPRFHIGESLMPETYWVFKRLNMLPKMKASRFVKKYSVQFTNPAGKDSQPFYFDEKGPHECSQTWQIVRSEFDQMMLDNAAEQGVEVCTPANVSDVLLEPGEGDLPRATGVIVSRNGEKPRTIHARVVVDATGINALLSRKLNIRQRDPMLRKMSIFAHYRGARRDVGKNEGATLVLATPNQDGWFWYIPLPDDIVSIGVVAEPESLLGRGTPEANAGPSRSATVAASMIGWPMPSASPRYASSPTSPIAPPAAPATAGCWLATPSVSLIRSTPPAFSSR